MVITAAVTTNSRNRFSEFGKAIHAATGIAAAAEAAEIEARITVNKGKVDDYVVNSALTVSAVAHTVSDLNQVVPDSLAENQVLVIRVRAEKARKVIAGAGAPRAAKQEAKAENERRASIEARRVRQARKAAKAAKAAAKEETAQEAAIAA